MRREPLQRPWYIIPEDERIAAIYDRGYGHGCEWTEQFMLFEQEDKADDAT